MQLLLICFFIVFHCRSVCGGGAGRGGSKLADEGRGPHEPHSPASRPRWNPPATPASSPWLSSLSPYRWSPHLFPQSESIFTLPLPHACPPLPFLPSVFPFFPPVMWKGDGSTCGGAERNLFGLVCQPIFIKHRRGIFSCYASLL